MGGDGLGSVAEDASFGSGGGTKVNQISNPPPSPLAGLVLPNATFLSCCNHQDVATLQHVFECYREHPPRGRQWPTE